MSWVIWIVFGAWAVFGAAYLCAPYARRRNQTHVNSDAWAKFRGYGHVAEPPALSARVIDLDGARLAKALRRLGYVGRMPPGRQ